jgi:hypothetical protein
VESVCQFVNDTFIPADGNGNDERILLSAGNKRYPEENI